jgi:hypothetical protein
MKLTACLICFFVWSPYASYAQTTDRQDWQAVMQLPAAANVRVQTKDKHKKTGWFVAATDTEVKLEDDGEIFTFRRDEIKKLWQLREPNRTKQRIFSGIGTGAGLIAGVLTATSLGFKQCGGSCNDERVGIYAAMIGLPVAGGVIGYKLAGNGKPMLVYAAP